ncbi:uncharacterized protein BXZ73DRAFT_105477 [Epithele typhae]|uniref:uncharacterized protein n=1 Tax=Epithele typhae TaxID=378194 RepID=UPI002007EE80|nr:uncharacterized protein BXZ73DRAFT_105477 [Epithele typhae]KAH9917654.1 hypothetical protein BXZ73DRAFT_105477 [Epithele typhae]
MSTLCTLSNTTKSSRRLRVDGEGGESHNATQYDGPIHDDEFWLEDGNVILTMLPSKSIADCTIQASSIYDGSPTVVLSDAPATLRHLLRAVMSTTIHLLPDPPGHYSIHQLSALVRLGNKYQMEHVQVHALAALKTYFTANQCSFTHPIIQHFSVRSKTCGIEAIHLARLTNTPSMLPVAFYTCSWVAGDIADGWTREDGSIVHLSGPDLKRLINGLAPLRQRIARLWEKAMTNAQKALPDCVTCETSTCACGS